MNNKSIIVPHCALCGRAIKNQKVNYRVNKMTTAVLRCPKCKNALTIYSVSTTKDDLGSNKKIVYSETRVAVTNLLIPPNLVCSNCGQCQNKRMMQYCGIDGLKNIKCQNCDCKTLGSDYFMSGDHICSTASGVQEERLAYWENQEANHT